MRIVFCIHAIVVNFGAQRGRCLTRDFFYRRALIKIVRSDYSARINVVNGVVAFLYREEISAFRATNCNQFLGCDIFNNNSFKRYIPCLRYARCDRYDPMLELIIYRMSIRVVTWWARGIFSETWRCTEKYASIFSLDKNNLNFLQA